MTATTIGVAAYQVNSNHPDTRYGRPAVLSLRQTAPVERSFFRCSTASIPAGAVVSAATITFHHRPAVAGTVTWTIKPVVSSWTSKLTWGTIPDVDPATTVTATTTDAPAGGPITFDVTTLSQQAVSAARTDRGWQLSCDHPTTLGVYGTTADEYAPELVVTWTTPEDAPENLNPASGAVSVAAPVLTFTSGEDTTAVQVQVDPAADATAPAFDSGEVAATGGYLELSTTSYAGLADGASTQWRARAKNSLGWSAWSDWVSFSRAVKPVLTLSAPAASVADGTPPYQWSFTGQVAWQASLLDASGTVLADSGRTTGAGTAWTPPKGLTVDGQTGSVRVRCWDAVDRTATPGDPVYIEVAQPVTLALDSTVGAMDSLFAASTADLPSVALTGARAAGIPDEVVIFRDGAQVARLAGTDVFTGTAFAWADWTCPQDGRPHTWRVAPVVNGKVASGGPSASATPTSIAIWLVDAEPDDVTNPAKVAVRTGSAQDQSAPETLITHQPITGDSLEVIVRRLVRLPRQGSIAGNLETRPGISDPWADEATMLGFAAADVGHTYRLILGALNLLVVVSGITVSEVPVDRAARVVAAAFDWYERA